MIEHIEQGAGRLYPVTEGYQQGTPPANRAQLAPGFGVNQQP